MSKFKQVLNYIAGYDPEFPKHIKAATQTQIDELDSILVLEHATPKIPESYRSFLEFMGASQDWLIIKDVHGTIYDFSIDKLIEFHKCHQWLAIDDTFCLALGPNNQNLYIARGYQKSDKGTYLAEKRIESITYQSEETRIDDLCDTTKFVANSLVELICLSVFEHFEILAKNRQHRAYVISHKWERECDFLGGLEAQLLKDGFEKLWFSDLSKAYLRDDVAIKILTHKNIRYTYWLSADSEEILDHYDELIDQYKRNFNGPLGKLYR